MQCIKSRSNKKFGNKKKLKEEMVKIKRNPAKYAMRKIKKKIGKKSESLKHAARSNERND